MDKVISKRITEICSVSGQIDHEHLSINHVKILGTNSSNGRTYHPQAVQDAKEQFEGARVYLGHTDELQRRDPLSYAGTLSGLYIKENELYGKLQVENKSKWEAISSIAEARPDVFGLSIEGDVHVDIETETQVYGFKEAGIVALVDNPATVKSIFEQQENTDVNIKELTVKKIKEEGHGSELLAAFEALEADIIALKQMVLGEMPPALAPVVEHCETPTEIANLLKAWKEATATSKEEPYSVPVKEELSDPKKLRAELVAAFGD